MTKAMRLKSTEQMARELAGATSLVLVDPQKMTSTQAVELRSETRHAGGHIRVLKNAVAAHALKQLGQDELAKQVAGMNALIWTQDPVPALKALFGYRAKNKKPQIRGGSIDGALADPAKLEALSKLPGRKEMLGMFVGTLAAPISSFASVLNTLAGQFVQVLDAIRREKEKAS